MESNLEETKTYELGMLLTPLLTEEAVAALMAGEMKQRFDRLGLKLDMTNVSKMIPLAYTIRKRIENKNQIFREAYFASIRFSALSEVIPELTIELRQTSEVIRFLIVTIPKVTEAVPDRRLPVVAHPPAKPMVEGSVTNEEGVEIPAVNKAERKEAIDQEIDELLAATTNLDQIN